MRVVCAVVERFVPDLRDPPGFGAPRDVTCATRVRVILLGGCPVPTRDCTATTVPSSGPRTLLAAGCPARPASVDCPGRLPHPRHRRGLTRAPLSPASRAPRACRPLRPRRTLHEAHLPAQQPPSQQEARLPGADADSRRSRDRQEPSPQGPQAAQRLSPSWSRPRCRLRERLRASADISAVFAARRSRAGRLLVVHDRRPWRRGPRPAWPWSPPTGRRGRAAQPCQATAARGGRVPLPWAVGPRPRADGARRVPGRPRHGGHRRPAGRGARPRPREQPRDP